MTNAKAKSSFGYPANCRISEMKSPASYRGSDSALSGDGYHTPPGAVQIGNDGVRISRREPKKPGEGRGEGQNFSAVHLECHMKSSKAASSEKTTPQTIMYGVLRDVEFVKISLFLSRIGTLWPVLKSRALDFSDCMKQSCEDLS
jgi:hypothetical protein